MKRNINKYFLISFLMVLFLIIYISYDCHKFITTSINDYNVLSKLTYDFPSTLNNIENLSKKDFYYLRYQFKNNSHMSFSQDKNGIIKYTVKNRLSNNYFKKITIKNVYNPVRINEIALEEYNKYIETGRNIHKENFLKQVDWILENYKVKSVSNIKYAYLVYSFNFSYVKAPWISGMSQGMSLSSLVRAFNITKDRKYLEAAKLFRNSYFIPIDKGGITYFDGVNKAMFEEYILNPPNHVLNGAIFAWFGLYDYCKLTHDQESKALLNKAVNFLKVNTPKYDNGYWSYYDYPNPGYSGPHFGYHYCHIALYRIMYKLTGEKFFDTYANQWENYSKSPKSLILFYFYKKWWAIKRIYWSYTSIPYEDIKALKQVTN